MDSRQVADRYERVADQTAPEWTEPPTRWHDIVGPAVVGLVVGCWVFWPALLGC